MKENLAIEVNDLTKSYKLGTIGGGTLRGEVESRIALMFGKDDPNSIIGTHYAYRRKFNAIENLSFDIKKGEAVGIIGHNGAGKSTLLKILSRITAPTKGTIKIRGRISSMLEVGTGFHGELTGRENIYLNAAILGMKKSEVDEKIDKIIDFSECREFIDTPVKRYSSGMYVKLAFAVAAHLDSEILIMDEVLAVGDVKFQEKCLSKMNEIATKEGRTILYVSHNMNTIKKLCDRCIVLEHGKKIFDGNTDKAIEIYLGKGKQLIENNSDNINNATNKRIGKLVSCEVGNRENNVFEMGDIINVKLGIHSYETCKDLHLRFIVKYLDSTIAGTFFSRKFDLERNRDNYLYYNIDLKNIPEGEFYIQIVLSKTDSDGLFEDYSSVESALQFTIIPNKDCYAGLKWRRSWNVNLGELELMEFSSDRSIGE